MPEGMDYRPRSFRRCPFGSGQHWNGTDCVTCEGEDEGLAFFKQQVIEDFQSSSTDMKDAFGPQESHGQALGLFRGAMGTVAGAVAAVRLAPIRCTRLAAHSVAAVARREMPDVETETVQEVQAATADDRGAVAEFSHLKQQVMRDFSTSRKEIGTAFACILSEKQDSAARAQTSTEDEQYEPRSILCSYFGQGNGS